jgi:quercetin 2,3-dioxygenase
MSTSALPGTGSAYHLSEGQGARFVVGAQLVTILARPEDSSNLVEVAVVCGGPRATVPRHLHPAGHECLFVLDGAIDLTLGGARHRMTRGTFASIPPGTSHGYLTRQHYTRVLMWSVGGALAARVARLGTPSEMGGYPTGTSGPLAAGRANTSDCDAVFEASPLATAAGESAAVPPSGATPFVLQPGDGERLIAAEQLFTFLAHGGNTGGRFIVLATLGPAGDKIPNHYHERHTETFFCVDGRMTMWASGRELALGPGDFVHVPAHTVHSYRLDAPVTRFVGLLSPGIFEPFFRTLCDPYPDAMFPEKPGPLRFDRVMQKIAELDLKIVDPPRRPPNG